MYQNIRSILIWIGIHFLLYYQFIIYLVSITPRWVFLFTRPSVLIMGWILSVQWARDTWHVAVSFTAFHKTRYTSHHKSKNNSSVNLLFIFSLKRKLKFCINSLIWIWGAMMTHSYNTFIKRLLPIQRSNYKHRMLN